MTTAKIEPMIRLANGDWIDLSVVAATQTYASGDGLTIWFKGEKKEMYLAGEENRVAVLDGLDAYHRGIVFREVTNGEQDS